MTGYERCGISLCWRLVVGFGKEEVREVVGISVLYGCR